MAAADLSIDVRILLDGREVSKESIKELAGHAKRLSIPFTLLGEFEAKLLFGTRMGDGHNPPLGVLHGADLG